MNGSVDKTKKLFVLDTNVLISDPSAIFNFEDNDVYISMVVLEELDNLKKGHGDTAINARQASRTLEGIVSNNTFLGGAINIPNTKGKLYLGKSISLSENKDSIPDNLIIQDVAELEESIPDKMVILVSKDIVMRLKAFAAGLLVEDYFKEKTIDDIDLLYSGALRLETTFWDGVEVESHIHEGETVYRITGDAVKDWYPNQFIYIEGGEEFEGVVLFVEGDLAVVRLLTNYTNQNNVFGVNAKNREQNFLLNVLLDPEIDLITVLGKAGTGKSLLTIAAGLKMVVEQKRYTNVIMTRETVSVGEDIGFLPGTEEEKMAPWMGALTDNIEFLGGGAGDEDWEKDASKSMLMRRVQIKSLSFMRGRTFLNRFLIIDEAQNLTPQQVKTLVTRAGPDTKVVLMGNLSQIDTSCINDTTSGLTYIVNKFKYWEHSAHITLKDCERSRLADFASDVL